jgi:prepilin-type N-terminal cleavage/methylation domain-containing protein
MKKRCTGFTLVEILVVLGIIAILAALLFPAFGRARESARQANCQSNLQQIALAVDQYRKEEGRYPAMLLDLLGEGTKFVEADGKTIGTLNANVPAYFKGGIDGLVCQDDDSIPELPRSSYGSLSKAPLAQALPAVQATAFDTFVGDYGNYVWNYWGMRQDGFAYASPAEAAAASWSKPAPHAPFGTPPPNAELLVDPSRPYNHPDAPNYDNSLPVNVIKFSLSNRYAPPSTIITHCVYHRLPTANNLIGPGMLYVGAASDSANAREIVARVEPNSKGADVSDWFNQKTWQIHTK